jgi:coenzyme F420-dependent glucose-6-phosphate dehydrogenase
VRETLLLWEGDGRCRTLTGERRKGDDIMVKIGYSLSSEEHGPQALVRNARRAEEAGFSFALISDHYLPWTDRQGESAFVWSVIGAIARETERLVLGTGVTCPTFRIHPAIIAHAAATCAALMPGRFFLGVGSGENLNEHILGQRWPSTDIRQEMMEEAVQIIRKLWKGGLQSHRGQYYTVENARIYSLPKKPPPIAMAAGGSQSAKLAGRIADAMVGTSPQNDLVQAFQAAGGGNKPRYGKVTVCWAETEEQGRRTAREWWPNIALKGELGQELPLPAHFEQATANVSEDDVVEVVVCGPDPERHVQGIREYADAGYDQVYVHQVGPDQEGFFRFYETEVLPNIGVEEYAGAVKR